MLVSLRGPGSAFDAWTDARGRYELRVPPGKYEVTAFPPPAYSARHLQQTVELRDARACFVAGFGVQFDGRIKGVVRQSSGASAAGVTVEVMAAESVGKTGNLQTLRALTDAGGAFEFTEVSPGRYVVGVDLTRRLDTRIVFPTTFHPGTPDAALATVVELGGGQHRQLDPMLLPPARRPYRLTGTVVFGDGNPASGAFISLRDGAPGSWRQVAIGIRTGFDGSFTFVVHEGFSYVAQASFWNETERMQLGGNVGPFVVSGDTEALKVVLSPRR